MLDTLIALVFAIDAVVVYLLVVCAFYFVVNSLAVGIYRTWEWALTKYLDPWLWG
jgi:hypothetical protein